jgi:hypothetical protein
MEIKDNVGSFITIRGPCMWCRPLIKLIHPSSMDQLACEESSIKSFKEVNERVLLSIYMSPMAPNILGTSILYTLPWTSHD